MIVILIIPRQNKDRHNSTCVYVSHEHTNSDEILSLNFRFNAILETSLFIIRLQANMKP